MKTNTYYHIYNHANGFENLFLSDENYRFFLEKYFLFIAPIADTYSYCLMPNHFHLLVKIKDEKEIIKLINNKNNDAPFLKFRNLERVQSNIEKFETLDKVQLDIEKYLSKQFSNLFSSYTQAFNKMYKRRGSLFIKTFKRKEVTDHYYLKRLLIYIHTNPIHHRFTKDINNWKWNSYFKILETIDTCYISKEIINWFDSLDNFKESHQQSIVKKNEINSSIFLE